MGPSLQTGSGPRWTSIADVNEDSQLDLVVANTEDNTVSIFHGDANGDFQLDKVIATERRPFSIAVEDIDGDRDLDLAVVNEDAVISRGLMIFVNRGEGVIQEPVNFDAGPAAARSLVAGDVNGDELVDVVAANDGLTISVMLGNGQGDLQPPVSLATPEFASSLAMADMNNDNFPDLIAAHVSVGLVTVYLNQGDGTFGSATSFAAGTMPTGLATSDLDNDFDIDVIVVDNMTSDVLVLNNDGTGVLEAPIELNTAGNPVGLQTVDIDQDDDTDLVVISQSGSVAVHRNDGGQFAPVESTSIIGFGFYFDSSIVSTPNFLAVGDVTNDGFPDVIAVGNEDTLFIQENEGDGTFTPLPEGAFPVGIRGSCPIVGDVDRDGLQDIIVSNAFSEHATLLLNQGDGAFSERIEHWAGDSNASFFGTSIPILLADLDGDDDLDLIKGFPRGDNRISVLINDCVLFGDVNLDGNVDLLDAAGFAARIASTEFQIEADLNRDKQVNLLDVAPFVDLLTGQ